jgi:hypothetical protein
MRRWARIFANAAFFIFLSLTIVSCSHSGTSTPNGLGAYGGGGLGNFDPNSSYAPPPNSNLALPTPTPLSYGQQYCLTQNSALSNGFGAMPTNTVAPYSNYFPNTGGTTGTGTGTYTNGTGTYTNGSSTSATAGNPYYGNPTDPYQGYNPGQPLNCYNGNVNYDPSTIYNAGLQSLQFMGQCYQMAAQAVPPPGAAPQDVANAFAAAQQQLVNCYQNILQQQMAFAPWQPPQQQSFQTNNQALFILLSIFAGQH